MKKSGLLISMVFVILSLFLCGTCAIAAEKIGFINLEEILIKSDAGKKAEGEFTKIVEKDRAKIQAMEAELKKDKDEIEKQRSVLKENAMKEKEAVFQKKFRDYQLLVKDANEELQAKKQVIFKELVPAIIKVVNAIGEKEKYTLIIDVSSIQLPYYSKDTSLTNRVIEEFNKTFKSKN